MIEIKDLSVTFEDVDAVRDVNLTIQDGDIFGIVGYSGAGKSTLLRTINGLQKPSQGQVEIDGVNINALEPAELREARHSIGMIFQDFNLLMNRTVLDNVIYPIRKQKISKAEKAERAHELLKMVGIDDKADVYPRQLSGGQQQRCAIARALASRPKILLCDEATSALDPKTTLQILSLLKQVNEELGITIVIITHQMEVVKEICNRCAVMDKGRLVEAGDTVQIFAKSRNPLTRSFVATSDKTERILQRIESGEEPLQPDEVLARISFIGDSATDPIIIELYKRWGLIVNIIAGSLEIIAGTPVGSLLVGLRGDYDKILEADAALRDQGVDFQLYDRDLGHGGGSAEAQAPASDGSAANLAGSTAQQGAAGQAAQAGGSAETTQTAGPAETATKGGERA